MRADAGPSQPKPEAIVLISTCFQQQNGAGPQFSMLFSMRSDRSRPKLMGFVRKVQYNNEKNKIMLQVLKVNGYLMAEINMYVASSCQFLLRGFQRIVGRHVFHPGNFFRVWGVCG